MGIEAELLALVVELQHKVEALESKGNARSTPYGLRLPVQTVAPASPVDGDLAFADGVGWNPGGGAGTYERRGGAWVKL